jgi:hypothetical protein
MVGTSSHVEATGADQSVRRLPTDEGKEHGEDAQTPIIEL